VNRTDVPRDILRVQRLQWTLPRYLEDDSGALSLAQLADVVAGFNSHTGGTVTQE